MDTVNRFALVLEPTEAYLKWATGSPEGDDELTLEELQDDATVYLIPETTAGPDAFLRRNYAAMFERELASWCTDESFWPKNRSFKTFKRFFRVRLHSVVIDLGKSIRKSHDIRN